MKFDKNLFNFDGMYLTYGPERRFVARFKYRMGGKASHQSFMIKHFTVEEYFQRMDAGESPLAILQSKGYILPHIKKWMKRDGYPVTKEGYDLWQAAYSKKIKAHYAAMKVQVAA